MRRPLFSLILLFAVVFCSACAPSRDKSPVPADEQPSLIPPTDAFTIVSPKQVDSFDPHFARNSAERHLSAALFEGLVVPDPKGGAPRPGLAESWSADEEGTRYTFKLRGAEWNDGVPITAETVAGSWLRLMNPVIGSPYGKTAASYIKGGESYNAGIGGEESVGIEVIDDRTLRVKLNEAVPSILSILSQSAFAVLPLHRIAAHGEEWTEYASSVSCGPFTLGERGPVPGEEAGELFQLYWNGQYWDRQNVTIHKISFIAGTEEGEAISLFTSGEADWLLPGDTYQDGFECSAEAAGLLITSPSCAAEYYVFQTERPPLDDPRVRKALSLSLDKEVLAEFPAGGIVPPVSGYPVLGYEAPDPETAKSLLAEAGYPKGSGFPKISILINESDVHRRTAGLIQRQWEEGLGISCGIVEQEWKSYLSYRRAGEFFIVRAGWKSDIADPLSFLSMFRIADQYNCGRYSGIDFDRLLAEASGAVTRAERYAALAAAEKILVNRDAAVLPLYYYGRGNCIDTDIWGGWYANVLDYHPLKDIYLR